MQTTYLNLIRLTLHRCLGIHLIPIALHFTDATICSPSPKGYGIATFPDTPVTASTLFYAGSTTKAHVAAALGHMIDSGNYTTDQAAPLSWQSPLSSILRADFVLEDPWATAHVTLEDALSHRTGLPRHDLARAASTRDGRPAGPGDLVRILRHLPMTAEPRTAWQYCNLMFITLSHAVETLAGGRWLGGLLREWLWEPLGMNDTFFSLEDALAAPGRHLARGYYWDDEGGRFGAVPHMTLHEVSGAGSVISTADDYARWMRFWLDEAAPLSKEAHLAVKAPKIFVDDDPEPYDTPEAYASGWSTSSYRGHRWWSHSGGMDAYGAEIFIFPGLRFGVATLANTAITSNAIGEVLVWHLLDNKLAVPQEQRWDWEGKYVLDLIQKELRGWGCNAD